MYYRQYCMEMEVQGTTSSEGCCANDDALVHDDRRNFLRGKRPRPRVVSHFSLLISLISPSSSHVSPSLPFLGVGSWGHSIPRVGAVALGKSLSSTSVEEGGSVRTTLFIVFRLFLSLSLSFFSLQGPIALGFGKVAAVMCVATASPPPRFLVSLSVFTSLPLSL